MLKFKGLLILLLLVLVGVLTSCSNTATENKGNETKDDPISNDAQIETAAWPRTFQDALGKEFVIEKKPDKLASLWFFYPEILVALGESPVAATEKEYLSSLSYLQGKLNTAEELGDKVSPNIERIFSLDPDFIIATEHHEKLYEELEKIAPVIVFNTKDIFEDWQYGLREVAKIIGKEDEAEKVIERMLTEIATGRESLQFVKEESVALIISWDGKTFNVLGEENPVYTLAFDKERGLGLTPDQSFKGNPNEFSTFEGLSTIEADHIFLIGNITKEEALMHDLEQSSVWGNLTAVKKGNVYLMDTSAITGGPLAIQYALQNIISNLLK